MADGGRLMIGSQESLEGSSGVNMRKGLLSAVVLALMPDATARGDGVDRFGDPLPPGAIARFGFVRTGWSSPLNIGEGPFAAFSADGKFFASVCYDRTYVWETATGRVKRRLSVGDDRAGGPVRFVNEGRWLMAPGRGRLSAWDVATGREVWLWKDTPGVILWADALFSPHGRWVIDGSGTVWDLLAAKKSGRLDRLPRRPAVFSGDERYLFVATYNRKDGKDDYTLEQWDVATGKLRQKFSDFAAAFLASSPDGRTIAAVRIIPDPKVVNKSTYTMLFFDVVKGRELYRMPERHIHFRQPVFSSDGKQLAAVDAKGTLHLWDVASGKTLHTWSYRDDYLHFLAFSPDGEWVGCCGQDGTAVLWNTRTGEPRFLSEEVLRRPTALTFTRDGKQLISGHRDGSVRFWDVASQRTERVFHFGDSPAYSAIPFVGWSHDPRYLIFQKPKGEFALLDLNTGKDTAIALGKGVEVMKMSGRTMIIGPPQPARQNFQWRPLTPEQIAAAKKEAQARPELRDFRIVLPTPAQGIDNAGRFTFRSGGRHPVPTHSVVLSGDGKYSVEAVWAVGGDPFSGMGQSWGITGL